jgi:DUF971 family protein
MKPTSIKRSSPTELTFLWDDGHDTKYTFQQLRDLCPCAGCAGETILFREYHAPEQDKSTPGRYTLNNIQPIGSYAIQLTWGDGHNTGIYTYEYLLQLTTR